MLICPLHALKSCSASFLVFTIPRECHAGSGSAEMNGTADKEVKSVQNANDSQLEDKEGVNSESTSASSQERDAKEHTADPGRTECQCMSMISTWR